MDELERLTGIGRIKAKQCCTNLLMVEIRVKLVELRKRQKKSTA